MPDAFGKALMEYLNGNKSPYIIRRDDGLIEEQDTGEYFTEYDQWENCEKEILKYARGRVLDIVMEQEDMLYIYKIKDLRCM